MLESAKKFLAKKFLLRFESQHGTRMKGFWQEYYRRCAVVGTSRGNQENELEDSSLRWRDLVLYSADGLKHPGSWRNEVPHHSVLQTPALCRRMVWWPRCYVREWTCHSHVYCWQSSFLFIYYYWDHTVFMDPNELFFPRLMHCNFVRSYKF